MIRGMNTDKTVIFQAFKEKSINESLSKKSFLLNILFADFLDHIKTRNLYEIMHIKKAEIK